MTYILLAIIAILTIAYINSLVIRVRYFKMFLVAMDLVKANQDYIKEKYPESQWDMDYVIGYFRALDESNKLVSTHKRKK